MSEKNQGSGDAADAGVAAEDNVTDFDEKAAAKAYNALMKKEAAAAVAGIKSRIAKLEEHLEGAKQALAQAIAEEKDL